MKAVWRYVLFGVAMYGVFLLGTMPASLVYKHWLQSRLAGWTLYGVQGTVWEGRASQVRSSNLQVENLHWDLHPWALLWGRVEAALRFDYQAAPGNLVIGRGLTGNGYLNDVAVELPAEQLQALLRLPGAELGGKLTIQLSSLVLKQGRITAADGNLSWVKAALRKPTAVELGSFDLSVQTTADGIDGKLLDRGGAVQAQGVFKLQPDGRYQITATFASRDPQQALIAQGLRLFGAPGPDGRIKYTATGVIPALLPGAGRT